MIGILKNILLRYMIYRGKRIQNRDLESILKYEDMCVCVCVCAHTCVCVFTYICTHLNFNFPDPGVNLVMTFLMTFLLASFLMTCLFPVNISPYPDSPGPGPHFGRSVKKIIVLD